MLSAGSGARPLRLLLAVLALAVLVGWWGWWRWSRPSAAALVVVPVGAVVPGRAAEGATSGGVSARVAGA